MKYIQTHNNKSIYERKKSTVDKAPSTSLYYPVENILKHEIINGQECYYIKWKNYPKSASSSEPKSHVKKTIIEPQVLGDYEVEKILQQSQVDLKTYYLVQWTGHQETSWEPATHLNHCDAALSDFKSSLNPSRSTETDDATFCDENGANCDTPYIKDQQQQLPLLEKEKAGTNRGISDKASLNPFLPTSTVEDYIGEPYRDPPFQEDQRQQRQKVKDKVLSSVQHGQQQQQSVKVMEKKSVF